MKSSEKKTSPVPSEDQGRKVNGCDHHLACVPTLNKIGECIISLLYKLISDHNKKSVFTTKEEIADLSEMKQQLEFFFILFNQGIINLVDKQIEDKKTIRDSETQSIDNKKKPDSGELFQQVSGRKKVVINGGSMEFGMAFGNFAKHLKNNKGQQLFLVDDIVLADFIFSGCVMIKDKPFNPDTLAISIGIGAKAESIIVDQGKGYFKKIIK